MITFYGKFPHNLICLLFFFYLNYVIYPKLYFIVKIRIALTRPRTKQAWCAGSEVTKTILISQLLHLPHTVHGSSAVFTSLSKLGCETLRSLFSLLITIFTDLVHIELNYGWRAAFKIARFKYHHWPILS